MPPAVGPGVLERRCPVDRRHDGTNTDEVLAGHRRDAGWPAVVVRDPGNARRRVARAARLLAISDAQDRCRRRWPDGRSGPHRGRAGRRLASPTRCRSGRSSRSSVSSMGIWFLVDRQASSNVAALVYDLIGNPRKRMRSARRERQQERRQARPRGGRAARRRRRHLVLLRRPERGRHAPERPLAAAAPAVGIRRARRSLLLTLYLVWPVVLDDHQVVSPRAPALANYEWALTTPANQDMYFNNLLWLVVGVAGSVGLGLLIAGLVDRVRYESIAKTFIFLPLAISLVGASVIWRFVYAWKPPGQPQYGLLNADLDEPRPGAGRRGSRPPTSTSTPSRSSSSSSGSRPGSRWSCCRPRSRACPRRSPRPRASTARPSGSSS